MEVTKGGKKREQRAGSGDRKQTMDGGVNGGEDDVTFAYRRSTSQRLLDQPISLISQPLVGQFPGLPSALCPGRPSPWDERHPRY